MDLLLSETLPQGVADELVLRHLGEILSDREVEVAQLAVAGLTTSEIARRLFVSQNTVKTHIRHILRKAGATNRTELTDRLLLAEANRVPTRAPYVNTERYAHLRDPLTGLLSQEAFGHMITQVQGTDSEVGLSVLFLRLDGLASLPDLDRIAVDLAITTLLAATVRNSDMVFHWGDGQFVGLLPNVDRAGARQVCMRLALCLCRWAEHQGYDLLFSLSASSSHEGISTPDGLVEAAQKRLDLSLGNSA